VRVALGRATVITHLKIFGASPYLLGVRTSDGTAIQGLEHVSLDALGAGWNVLRLPDSTSADEFVLELTRTDGSNGSAPAPICSHASPVVRRDARVDRNCGRAWTNGRSRRCPKRRQTCDGIDRIDGCARLDLCHQHGHFWEAFVARLGERIVCMCIASFGGPARVG
jgi:hypothetical protein